MNKRQRSKLIESVCEFWGAANEEIIHLEQMDRGGSIRSGDPFLQCRRNIEEGLSGLEATLDTEAFKSLGLGVSSVGELISGRKYFEARRKLREICTEALKVSQAAAKI